ncbi:MAG: zinc ribbon domain-containing protein [Thermoproteota archaeon]
MFILPLLVYTERFITYVTERRDIGVSGLIDFLGGFIPSTIGMVGIVLCIIGSIFGLTHKPLPSKDKIIKSEESIACSKCGAINDAHYKFCSKCGTKLSSVIPTELESPEETETAELIVCPVCGKQISEGSKFCSKCGSPISEAELPPPPPPDIESKIKELEEKIRELEVLLKKTVQPKGEEKSENRESIFEE